MRSKCGAHVILEAYLDVGTLTKGTQLMERKGCAEDEVMSAGS